MHLNAFGGQALPEPGGELIALPSLYGPSSWIKGEGGEKGRRERGRMESV